VSRGELAEAKALFVAQSLRRAGFIAELDLSGAKFDKQLKRASSAGAKAAIILGNAEIASGQVQLKWLATKEQQAIAVTDITTNPEIFRQTYSQYL
jgi:histidyl-tRNA synthetase